MGQFRRLSGAGATNEEKQKAFVPPPAGRAGRVPREVFRGKYRISPAGFASRGRVVSPRRETRRPPLGASGAPPAALRAAPRAGASPVLQTSPRGTAPPRHRNILRNTLNSGFFHLNLPGQPPQIQRYLVSHPAKGYLVNHHSIRIPSPSGGGVGEADGGGIPPRRTGEVPRFARRRGIRPARGKHKHFKRNNPRAPCLQKLPFPARAGGDV